MTAVCASRIRRRTIEHSAVGAASPSGGARTGGCRLIIVLMLLSLGGLAAAAERLTVGYFVQWGVYKRQYFVKNLDASGAAARLDVITYAFAKVGEDDRVALVDSHADLALFHNAERSVDGVPDTWDAGALRGNFNQLRKLKQKHPHLRVVVSIGGWTLSDRFSDMAMTAEGRRAFADSCVEVFITGAFAPGLRQPGIFDGIDIDWEYPGAPGNGNRFRAEDGANFSALLAEVRARLDAQGARDGKRYTLSVALGAGESKFGKVQLGAIHRHLDWINLMTYDYHGAWEPRTNFQAALHGRDDDPDRAQKLWCDHTVQALLAAGVPPRRINLGVPFHGRGWKDVPAGANHGLFQNGSGGAPGTYTDGVEDFKALRRLPATFGEHRDAATASYWRYDPASQVFWTHEDPGTIAGKRRYVDALDLGGMTVWELSGDDADGTLMQAVRPQAITVPPTANLPPTIAAIADQATTAGVALEGIAIVIADDHTTPTALTLGVSSSNTALLPSTGMSLGGSGANRTLSLAPVAGLSGSSTITVTVSDGVLSSSRTFLLSIHASTPTRTAPVPDAGGAADVDSGRCGTGALVILLAAIALVGLFALRRKSG